MTFDLQLANQRALVTGGTKSVGAAVVETLLIAGARRNSCLAAPDQQISLTDPDSRSMATSGRGSGVVGYNVQVAVDTEHHLIVNHEVTNVGSDRAQLATLRRPFDRSAKLVDIVYLSIMAMANFSVG